MASSNSELSSESLNIFRYLVGILGQGRPLSIQDNTNSKTQAGEHLYPEGDFNPRYQRVSG
jgi:hypothetical protein